MAPVSPIGQGSFTYQRPAQHPGVWEFVDAVEESQLPVGAPAAIPTTNLPLISLQVQEMLSRPEALETSGAAMPRPASREERDSRPDDRRVADRRARARTGQRSRREEMSRA